MQQLLFLSRQYIIKEGSYAVLPLKTPCENKCIFCKDSQVNVPVHQFNDFEPLNILKSKIRLALKRGAKAILLTGSDCLNHPLLLDIVRYCRCAGLKVRLETPGIKLKRQAFLKGLMESGADAFYLPIYGDTAALHDSIVGRNGAFYDLKHALDNLYRADNATVHLSTILLKQNYKHLTSLLTFMHKRYPRFFFKVRHVRPFSSSPAEYRRLTPRYNILIPVLKKLFALYGRYYGQDAEKSLKRFGFFIGDLLFSLPVCALIKIEPDLVRFIRLFPEEKTVSRVFSYSRRIRLSFCKSCAASNICAGIDSFYAKSYGLGEFAPIIKKGTA